MTSREIVHTLILRLKLDWLTLFRPKLFWDRVMIVRSFWIGLYTKGEKWPKLPYSSSQNRRMRPPYFALSGAHSPLSELEVLAVAFVSLVFAFQQAFAHEPCLRSKQIISELWLIIDESSNNSCKYLNGKPKIFLGVAFTKIILLT